MNSRNKDEPNVTALIAYVPTPHGGFLKLFEKYRDAEMGLYVLGPGFLKDFVSVTRHLPGVDPEQVVRMVKALKIFKAGVRLLEPSAYGGFFVGKHIVMSDEEVARSVAEKYFFEAEVVFDASWKLRWDWQAAQKERLPEGEVQISEDAFDQLIMKSAFEKSFQSPDWWRQVGAVLVQHGKPVLAAFNQHLPSEQTAYCYGDPRSAFSPGERIDVSVALHGEIGILTEAARRGIKTEGCDLYVTTFPCPPCAAACANAGLRRLYYAEGYSLLEGAAALSSRGVELIRVMRKPSS